MNIVDTTHPITSGLPAGAMTVFSTGVNMSVGQGATGVGTRVLVRRNGSSDAALWPPTRARRSPAATSSPLVVRSSSSKI
ncbi:MAG: hypothetical protein QM783_01730 [Phycisphaerales bacterium]